MKLHSSKDVDVLRCQNGGWVMFAFGFPLLILGLSLLSSLLLRIGPFVPDSQSIPPEGVAAGGLFALVGALLSFARRGVRLNRRTKEGFVVWIFLLPVRTVKISLRDCGVVTVRSKVRGSRNSSYTVYQALVGKDPVVIGEFRDREKTNQLAQDVASFLQIDVEA